MYRWKPRWANIGGVDRKLAWVGLNLLPSLTPRRLRLLLGRCGGPVEAWEALGRDLPEDLEKELGEGVVRERKEAHPEQELEKARRAGAEVLTLDDPAYPEPLRELPTAPPVLYMLGEWTPQDRVAVALVGTRRCSAYGRLVAKKLAEELASRGITVVSGLAPGIDTAAHQGALLSGRTIAVLGTGLGKVYPAGSEKLVQEIRARGAVLTEFPWDMPGSHWSFPRRNRLIAGLSLAVVVVEAPLRSGALITADYALEQGKEVLAVPGPITSEASAGTNRLIQEGAKLVTSVDDILSELGLVPLFAESRRPRPELEPDAEKIYGLLGPEPLDPSELVQRSGLSHARVAQILLELELAGLVQELPGRKYARV